MYMEKHFATNGITNAANVLTQPSWDISIYSGSIIASIGSTINAITRFRIAPFPLNSNFARAYPHMEFTSRSDTRISAIYTNVFLNTCGRFNLENTSA